MDEIREKLKTLPKTPGVYLMKNAAGAVIYVGKALSLKNRVSSYFGSGKKDAKTARLVGEIVDLGGIEPEQVITPSIFVDKVVQVEA